MNIRSSVKGNAVFPIALAIIITLGLVVESRVTGSARKKQAAADTALTLIVDFSSFSHALLLEEEKNAVQNWEIKRSALEKFLKSRQAAYLEEYLSKDLEKSYQRITAIVLESSKLRDLIKDSLPGAYITEKKKYAELKTVFMQEMRLMLVSVSGYAKLTGEQAEQIENIAGKLLMVLVGVFSIMMAGSIVAASNSINRRMKRLKEVAERITDGDFSQEIHAGNNDEVGQALISVNIMIQRLRKMYFEARDGFESLKEDSDAQKRTTEAVKDGNMRLADALTKLKRAQGQTVQQERLRALEQIGSGVTRDFNDALTPILSTSDFLLSYPDALENRDELLENLKIIHSAASESRKQVRRLSEMFRPHDHSASQCVDVNKVVEDAVRFVEPRWMSGGGSLRGKVNCRTELGRLLPVEGIESDLKDAVVGLLMNGVDAMRDEGGELVVKTEMRNNNVVLSVTDNGEGMSEEVRLRALEPFFSTRGIDRSGMGLTAAVSVAGRHGGTIDLHSTEGKGTTVIINLPVCTEDKIQMEKKNKEKKLTGKRMLVVDDEEWVRKIIQKCLIAQGHIVQAVADGEQAIKVCEKEKFDLVLLDRALPGISGDKVAKELKIKNPELPIILLSGFGDSMKRQGVNIEGVDAILGKPVTMEELNDAIKSVL